MHHHPKKYILLTAVLLITIAVSGQQQRLKSGSAVSEIVYFHVDKQVYVAGEQIRYKAYLVNIFENEPACSRIIYFNLKGTGIDNQLNWRINIDSSSATGSLLIPDNIKPGIYVLTAYTNWMRNNPASACYSDRIVITSLMTENSPSTRLFNPQNSISGINSPANDDVGLHLKTEKDEYLPNDIVKLELVLDHPERSVADISVSVNALSPFDSIIGDPDITDFISSRRLRSKNTGNCAHKIEDRGFILSGRVININKIPFRKCNVWLSVTDSVTPGILSAPVDSQGIFRFFLDRSFDNQELIIQLADPAMSDDCKIEVFGKNVILADSLTKPYFFKGDDTEYLSEIKNIRLVEAVYANKEIISPSAVRITRPAFLNVPDRVIIPSDFVDLRNFRDIASNILPEVKFGNRRDQFYLQVLSPNINLWKDNVIVMLNGVPFSDLAYISTLGTKDIRRIEVIQPNILVGKLTLPGLVSIFTYDCKIPENYLKSRTVRYKNTVLPVIQEKTEQTKHYQDTGGNIPDFRSCIFWEPFVKVSSGNKITLEFQTGLLSGRFSIRAEGITDDGIPVSATGYFQISEQ